MDSKFKVKQITKLYESCNKCGLPIINCICNIVPKIETKAKIWILSSEKEFSSYATIQNFSYIFRNTWFF